METVGAYEAKTHLSNLLERVIKGESITITKHGVPVAVLQPPETKLKRNPAEVISEVREFRTNYSLKGLSLREMIEEGRTK
jgi:prevent-host-death family protein